MENRHESTKSYYLKIWDKTPVLIKALVLGMIVSTIGIGVSQLVAILIPMPWSFFIMIGLLVLYLKYFSGSWWPKSTSRFRKMNFRAGALTKNVWIFAILGALCIVVIEQAGLVVTFRMMEFPAERFIEEYSFLYQFPDWTAWLVVIMISAVAAICEEVGFRGYMQVPLENRYGPVAAIVVVSIVFVLVHVHQAWAGPILLQIFFIGALFGILAYYSGSLIPGIIGHFIMDIFNFSFWWSKLISQFNYKPITATGLDVHFIIWFCVLILGIILFIVMISRLKFMNKFVIG